MMASLALIITTLGCTANQPKTTTPTQKYREAQTFTLELLKDPNTVKVKLIYSGSRMVLHESTEKCAQECTILVNHKGLALNIYIANGDLSLSEVGGEPLRVIEKSSREDEHTVTFKF